MGGSEVDVVVVAGAKGLNASGMLPHEASIIDASTAMPTARSIRFIRVRY
jgi:hypothetical protein